MPARDVYHDAVKQALINDGWTITDDPLHLKWGRKDMSIDLGASQLLAAQKEERKIAVEVKIFSGCSELDDLEKALGQYVLYFDVLSELQPERLLYLALPIWVYESLFEEPLGQLLLKKKRLRLIVFEPTQELIEQWIPSV
ncbi:MAG: XisH family protein [Cyanobacteriota bacterium]|nr:XisH family protein [Cyanobacteriota bacterium]